ncbi:MAG TPA: hypothetical protein VGJ04_00750, partial [Pirellulales bacterium]
MSSTPRPIFFSTELEVPPMKELAIGKSVVRSLFNKLHEPGGYAYENLKMQGERPCLSTERGEEAQSRCEIGRHLIKIEEHQPEMPVDEFVGVVKTVLRCLGEDCPPFFIQRCKIHCLMQTTNIDPLALLAGNIANVTDKIGPFGRFPSFFGVRFRFRPWDPEDFEEESRSDDESEKAESEPEQPEIQPTEPQSESQETSQQSPQGQAEEPGDESEASPADDAL